eukprot:5639561-Heterocapsa_arctica.AAC.1
MRIEVSCDSDDAAPAPSRIRVEAVVTEINPADVLTRGQPPDDEQEPYDEQEPDELPSDDEQPPDDEQPTEDEQEPDELPPFDDPVNGPWGRCPCCCWGGPAPSRADGVCDMCG